MISRLSIFNFFVAYCVATEDAASDSALVDKRSNISPELQPKSDKKFFGKPFPADYPDDERPAVDVLHFKHPYPAVQDSDDYDTDYVKDENGDNGGYKAQTEYDRLRHKLLKEKEDLEKALEAKNAAEKELRDAMRRHDQALKTTTKKPAKTGHVDKVPAPGGISSPGDVKVAAKETEKRMNELDECKKQLAEAREKLKKLMKELAEAKRRQEETQAELDAAKAHEEQKEAEHKEYLKSVKEEYKDYMDAREDYLKQQAIVAQMEKDIEIAAEKVRTIRNSEDSEPHLEDGGVYPSGRHKSAAVQCVRISTFAFVVVSAFSSLLL